MSGLSVGDLAPNFDLASTEGVVLMLHDELPRTPVLLYFFDEIEDARKDLEEMARKAGELTDRGIKILGVSAAKLDELATAQKELSLPFPLLHDDRGLAKDFVSGSGDSAVMVLVDRDRKVTWIGRDLADSDSVLSSLDGKPGREGRSTASYPGSVINRLVDRWVN